MRGGMLRYAKCYHLPSLRTRTRCQPAAKAAATARTMMLVAGSSLGYKCTSCLATKRVKVEVMGDVRTSLGLFLAPKFYLICLPLVSLLVGI
jgi:hypothetical protein